MTINVELSPQIQRRLEDLASEKDQLVEAYVQNLIESTVQAEVSIDTILEPFRQGFAESGMTEEEATSLLDSAIDEVRAYPSYRSSADLNSPNSVAHLL